MSTDEHHKATVLVRGDITVNNMDAEAVLRAFILARLVCASLPRGLHWMMRFPRLMDAYYRLRPSVRPAGWRPAG